MDLTTYVRILKENIRKHENIRDNLAELVGKFPDQYSLFAKAYAKAERLNENLRDLTGGGSDACDMY